MKYIRLQIDSENVSETRVCLLHLPLWSSVPKDPSPSFLLSRFILFILLYVLSNSSPASHLLCCAWGKVQRTKLYILFTHEGLLHWSLCLAPLSVIILYLYFIRDIEIIASFHEAVLPRNAAAYNIVNHCRLKKKKLPKKN